MALNSSTVWEFRTTGSDNNAGGFSSALAGAGTDYSQQDASQLSLTDLVTAGAGATTITTVAGTFTSAMVGNTIFIRSSTSGFQVGFYQIITFTNSKNVILDRTPTSGAAGVAGVAEVGGARINIDTNSWFSAVVAGNKAWIKVGTYTGSVDISPLSDGTALLPITLEGYNASRGDAPISTSRPTLARGTFASQTGNYNVFKYLIHTSSNTTGLRSLSGNNYFYYCKCVGAGSGTSSALLLTGGDYAVACEFTNPGGRLVGSTAAVGIFGCYFHDAVIGLRDFATNSVVANCIFSAVTTAISPGGAVAISGCTIYGAETPAGVGIDLSTNSVGGVLIINNIFYGLATGIDSNGSRINFGGYNDFFNNTTDRTNQVALPGDVAVNPQFTNAPAGNFAIAGAI